MNTLFTRSRNIAIILFFLANACTTSQQVSKMKYQDVADIQLIEVDFKGQYYLIEDGKNIKKYNEKGKLLFEFSHPDYNGITQLDVTDPYKITLFYRDQQKLIFLDNKLLFLSEVDLSKLENTYTSLFSRSEEGYFWIFDVNNQKLISVDEDLNILNESFPIYQEGITDFSAEYLDVGFKWIVIGDPEVGILLFDHLGNYRKKLPLKGIKSLLTYKEGIFLSVGDSFRYYNPNEIEPRNLLQDCQQPYTALAWDLFNRRVLFFKELDSQLDLVEEVRY